MDDNKEKTIELLNVLGKEGVLSLVLGSLISSDSLINVESCDKSIETLTSFLDVIDNTNLSKKDVWKLMMEKSLEIAKHDRDRFDKS